MRLSKIFDAAQDPKGLGQEIVAGITDFTALMGSLLVVPLFLQQAGIPLAGAYTASVLAALLGTLLLGVWVKRPLLLVPDAGIGAWLVYQVVIAHGASWQDALGASLAAALLCLLFCRAACHRHFLQGIPVCLRIAARGGLGLFLIFLGLRLGKLLVGSPTTVTMLGTFSEPAAFLALVGLLTTLVLVVNRVRGAVLWGTVAAAVLALLQGFMVLPAAPFLLPEGLDRTAGQVSFVHLFEMVPVVVTLFLMMLFNTEGVLWGMEEDADAYGHRVLGGMAAGTILGTLLGTTPLTVAPESSLGKASGGRSGHTAIVAALCLCLWLFCEPLAAAFWDFSSLLAPALMVTGALLLSSLPRITDGDLTDRLAAGTVLLLTPLSNSLTAGLGAGLILYTFLRLFLGQGRKVHLITYVLTVLFVLQFMFSEP